MAAIAPPHVDLDRRLARAGGDGRSDVLGEVLALAATLRISFFNFFCFIRIPLPFCFGAGAAPVDVGKRNHVELRLLHDWVTIGSDRP